MFESPREMFELVETKCGPGWAKAGLWAILGTALCTFAGAIGALAYYTNENVVQPYLLPALSRIAPSLPTASAPGYSGVALVSFVTTTLLLVGAVFLVAHRFRRWEVALHRAIDAFIKDRTDRLSARIERLELLGLDQRIEKVLKRLEPIERERSMRVLTEALVESEQALKIHSARYGIGSSSSQSQDVKDVIESNIKNGRIDMPVNNDTMKCDLFRGETKTLFITYSGGGHELPRTIAVKESHKLVIPEPMSFRLLANLTQ